MELAFRIKEGDQSLYCVYPTWDWELSLSLQERGIVLDELLRLQTKVYQHKFRQQRSFDPLAPARVCPLEIILKVAGASENIVEIGIIARLRCSM